MTHIWGWFERDDDSTDRDKDIQENYRNNQKSKIGCLATNFLAKYILRESNYGHANRKLITLCVTWIAHGGILT